MADKIPMLLEFLRPPHTYRTRLARYLTLFTWASLNVLEVLMVSRMQPYYMFQVGLKIDRMLVYLYPYLLYFMNTDMDMGVAWIQKFICIFVLNRYGYKLDTRSMDISQMIKLFDHEIKDITKQMINQINNMLLWPFIFFKNSQALYKIKQNQEWNRIFGYGLDSCLSISISIFLQRIGYGYGCQSDIYISIHVQIDSDTKIYSDGYCPIHFHP